MWHLTATGSKLFHLASESRPKNLNLDCPLGIGHCMRHTTMTLHVSNAFASQHHTIRTAPSWTSTLCMHSTDTDKPKRSSYASLVFTNFTSCTSEHSSHSIRCTVSAEFVSQQRAAQSQVLILLYNRSHSHSCSNGLTLLCTSRN